MRDDLLFFAEELRPSRAGAGPRHFGGWIPHPAGVATYPDHTGVYALDPHPPAYTVPRLDAIPVRDQGNRPTCVAQSVRSAREWLLLQTGISTRLAMEYVYDRAHTDGADGLTLPDAANVLTRFGLPHEANCPDDVPCSAARLAALDAEARYFLVPTVTRIPNLASCQDALVAGHAVVLGISLTAPQIAAITALTCSGTVPAAASGDLPAGGHAVWITGWQTDADGTVFLTFRNSWGVSWGTSGNGRIAVTPDLFSDAIALS